MTRVETGLLLVALLGIGFMLGTAVSMAQADEGRVPIPCPDGYTDCTGVPIDDTEATPTVEPEVAPILEPTPTETPFSCRHTHPDRHGEHLHVGKPHLAPDPVGVFDSYDAERCGHE